jgi:gentisate 1,2-dioxygenase
MLRVDKDLGERRQAFSERARKLHLIEGWWWESSSFRPRPDQPTEPGGRAVPYLWRYADLRAMALESGELVELGQGENQAEKRGLVLSNPSLDGRYAVTDTLFADLQSIASGEAAPSHRHTTTAVRLVCEGTGGWTTVEGQKLRLDPGDVVINSPWAWHDHGNDGPDDFIFWDVLDVPMLAALGTAIWDFDYSTITGDTHKTIQGSTRRDDYALDLYRTGGLVPKFIGSSRRDHSPLLRYEWKTVRAALNRLRQEAGSPYEGVIVEFTNPETGASPAPTLDVCAQLLRPGQRTLSHRHNTSTTYMAVQGEGATTVEGVRLDWTRNDFFVVPSWCWHEHANFGGHEDAVLYSISDAPLIEKIGLYREQRKGADGSIDDTAWSANRYVAK